MLGTIIAKELKNIIGSPKFVVTFAACSLLILLSLWVGIEDYKDGIERYDAALRLNEQSLVESTWSALSTRAYRRPDPMQIFVSGVQADVGRLSNINARQDIKLRNSVFSDDPIYAVFRFVDFAFIVQMVLSLFAILFTYDAINGEREGGTLQLTFSNPVPRAEFILGKFIGSWLGLVVPMCIPILIALLLVMVMKVPMSADHWQRVGAMLALSLLFFTFFIAFGLMASSLTKRSSTSFLAALVAWVVLVLIVPRAGVMAAGQFVSVPTMAEIESRQDGFEKEKWDRYRQELVDRWKERSLNLEGTTEEERSRNRRDKMKQWMAEDSESRKQMQAEIAEYSRKLSEERRNAVALQNRMAFVLSRFSPASAFRLAAMNLAETDIGIKTRAEDAMRSYREQVVELSEKRAEAEGGAGGGRSITMSASTGGGGNPKGGFHISFGGRDSQRPTINPAEVPVFEQRPRSLREAAAGTLIDVGLLSLFSLAAFSGAFVGFLRYDVR